MGEKGRLKCLPVNRERKRRKCRHVAYCAAVDRARKSGRDVAVTAGRAHPPDLKEAIEEFMQAWNQNPKPFIWTATVDDIIKKIDRARVKAEQIKPGSTLPRGKKTVVLL